MTCGMSKRAKDYKRALTGLPPLEEKPKPFLGGRRLSERERGELVKKLKGRGYFCDKCKDWHKLGDTKYRGHLEHANEVLESE